MRGLALAASGTVTVEAALLATPMVTFYRVNALSWILGRWLVRAPFLSMVNLIAGRRIVPELIQGQMTAEHIESQAVRLLDSAEARSAMRVDLAEVAARLGRYGDAETLFWQRSGENTLRACLHDPASRHGIDECRARATMATLFSWSVWKAKYRAERSFQ